MWVSVSGLVLACGVGMREGGTVLDLFLALPSTSLYHLCILTSSVNVEMFSLYRMDLHGSR